MIERLRRAREDKGGFTLIELLVVVIIIGILAAIAIPAFLGQQERAEDAEGKSLARNAATAVEAAYVDTRNYSTVTLASLNAIEPTIDFLATAGNTANDSVMYAGTAADSYAVSTVVRSGASDARTYTYTKTAAGETQRTFTPCATGATCNW